MSYDEFPWFRDVPVKKILNVEEPTPGHFYWPELDVDLTSEMILHPEQFPLKARQSIDMSRVTKKVLRLKSKDEAAIEEFVNRVRVALGQNLVEVKLFGSKATGTDAPDSDIDLLVTVAEAGVAVEDKVLDIAFDVNLKHEVYISPRVIDRATLTNPVWSITPFLKAIEQEGISL